MKKLFAFGVVALVLLEVANVYASQEFWHSWRTVQPATDRY